MLRRFWAKLCLKIRSYSTHKSTIRKPCKIGAGSNIHESFIDRYSYCGYDCWIINANIGAFCSIANNVKIGGASHPLSWVSTSPVFYDRNNILHTCFSNLSYIPYAKTHIGNDVWIGEGAIVLSGITIETGAVIGAGSVVTKNVGAYEIWAGNPARFIKKRMSDENIHQLLKSEWWLLSKEELYKRARTFNDIDAFLNGDNDINGDNDK